jgi:hypothetical protein
MSIANFVFTETSPGAAGTVASSQAVQNASSYFPSGVAGPMEDYDAVLIAAELKGATGDVLDVYVQMSPDMGLNWYDIVHFAQLTAGVALKSYLAPISNATTTTAPTLTGKNLVPALAVNTVVNGAFSDRMRLVMVAGAATSLGAAVVVRIMPQRSWDREGR